MTFEVLLSCMHQSDASIIQKSNLTNNRVLVVNQCVIEKETLIDVNSLHRVLHTATKGLSVSRNLALNNACADVCLLADDDETFVDGLEKVIISAYEKIPDADVIVFRVQNLPCKIRQCTHRLGELESFFVSSVQISFKISSIKNKVTFDENIGSGTPYGSGEDNKFVRDCVRNGLNVYFMPTNIAILKDSESQWFTKYDENFFYRDAMTNRYVMGLPLAIVYSMYFLLCKHNLYKRDVSFLRAAKQIVKGLKKRALFK